MKHNEYSAPIRIEKIELKNFKGVKNGVIEFNCLKKPVEKDTVSDIIGLYGQNGSGKSTLVEALHIAKIAMMGEPIPEDRFSNIISQTAKKAEMTITFQIKNQDGTFFHVEYKFSLENKILSIKASDISSGAAMAGATLAGGLGLGTLAGAGVSTLAGAGLMAGVGIAGAPIIAPALALAATTTAAGALVNKKHNSSKSSKNSKDEIRKVRRLVLSDEVLSMYGTFNGIETRLGPIFDTNTPEEEEIVFLPKAKHKLFFPQDTILSLKELNKYKKRYKYNSKSFIFSSELTEMLLDQDDSNEYANIILDLKRFAINKFRVLDSKILGIINNDVIPIYTANRGVAIRKTDSSAFLDDAGIETLKVAIDGLNVILKYVIPGLKLESVKQMGVDVANGERLPDDELGYTVTVYSVRDGVRIPIAEESAGIIRLITVLGQFSYAFANDDVTVIIDEIDAGIYEYLLGELLLLFEENGAGQLLFTCHNLRPMEVINKKFIYFTTTNPDNRYLKPKSIRKENNLRDVYLREIINGGQEEDLYANSKHVKIAAALQKAGELIGED